MESKRCLVIGDINIDFAIHSDRYPEEGGEALAKEADFRLGGSGCATAVCLQHAGIPTALGSSVGTDVFAEFAMRNIKMSGVDASLVQQEKEAQTGFFMILVTANGQRTMFGNRGANALPLPLDDVKEKLGQVDHLHISGYILLGEAQNNVARTAVEYAHEHGITVSLDPGVHTAEELSERVLGMLPLVDWFLPSKDELAALFSKSPGAGSGEASPPNTSGQHKACFELPKGIEKAITVLLSRGCGAVALKLGAEGSLYSDGKTTVHVPALSDPDRKVWNTTGAGDSFNAGFLKGVLSGASPEEALRLGNRAAFDLITSKHGLMDLIGRT